MVAISCNTGNKEEAKQGPQIPYPDARMAIYLQGQVDSSQFLWFTDVKGAASSFCNEEMRGDSAVTVGDVTILGESLFHARAEVRLGKKTIILTMDRAFKEKGKDSIWQIIKMEEKKK